MKQTDASARIRRHLAFALAPCGGQPGVNLGSTWGQPGVNLGSTWGGGAAPYHVDARDDDIAEAEHGEGRLGAGDQGLILSAFQLNVSPFCVIDIG